VSDKYNFNDTNAVHILNIPRAKVRGASGFRFAFNEVGIRESIAKILFEHIQILKQKLAKQIKREVSEQELAELPIFYDIKVLANLDWSNKKKFLKFCQQKLFIYLLSN
jgi:hypothetical protein